MHFAAFNIHVDERGLNKGIGGKPKYRSQAVDLATNGEGREAGAGLEGTGEDEIVGREVEGEHAGEEAEGVVEEVGFGEGRDEDGEGEGVGVGEGEEEEGGIGKAEKGGIEGKELGGEVGVVGEACFEDLSVGLLYLRERRSWSEGLENGGVC